MRNLSRIEGETRAVDKAVESFLFDVMTDLAYSDYGPRRKIADVFYRLILSEAATASYKLKEVALGR